MIPVTRKREIARMLREVREQANRESDPDGLEAEERGPREVKAYAGVDFDAFQFPDDAAGMTYWILLRTRFSGHRANHGFELSL